MSNSGTTTETSVTTSLGPKTKDEIIRALVKRIGDIRYSNGYSFSPGGNRLGNIEGVEATMYRYIAEMFLDIDLDGIVKDRNTYKEVAKAGKDALDRVSKELSEMLRKIRGEHDEGCLANMACSGTPCCCGVDEVGEDIANHS